MSEPQLYSLPDYRPSGRSLAAFGMVVLFMVLGCMAATQYVAWRMGYAPALGEPLFANFYRPYEYFVWLARYGRMTSLSPALLTGGAICAGVTLLGAVFGYLMSWNARKTLPVTDLHGSASWADTADVERSGLMNSQGVFLGEWQDKKRFPLGTYLRHDGPENVLIFAPPRSGKGVGFVIPTLLEWQHSVVVYDIKGENWELSSGWRASKGHTVLKFEPTATDGSSVRWNPLWEVRLGDNEVRDAQNIADILVDPDGDGELNHWQSGARTLLTAAILHVLYTAEDKSLREVALLLSDAERVIDKTLVEMMNAVHDPDGSRGWKKRDGTPLLTHPEIRATAREMLDKPEKERGSHVSTAVNCLNLFRADPVIARNTAVSDFMVRDLMHHDKPVSLYLVVPPPDISRTRVLMRMALNLLGRKLTEKLGGYNHRLLLLLDEFPTLRRLEFFQESLAFMAGYGIRAMIIVQDLSQLYSAYGERESISSSCHIRVALTPNKVETAELISRMTGVQTVLKHSRNISGKRAGWMLSNISESLSEAQRPLMTTDEVSRLPSDKEIIFVAGHSPILAQRVRYYENEAFTKRSGIPAPQTCTLLTRKAEELGFPTVEQPVATALAATEEEDSAALPPFGLLVETTETESEEEGSTEKVDHKIGEFSL